MEGWRVSERESDSGLDSGAGGDILYLFAADIGSHRDKQREAHRARMKPGEEHKLETVDCETSGGDEGTRQTRCLKRSS